MENSFRKSRPYELKEYNPEWKEIFTRTAEKIKPILGNNLIRIEHIGSTSIEGMVAKPQVDILAVVKDLNLIKDCYKAFEGAGYTPQGREYVKTGEEYVTEDAPDNQRLVSIHIFEEGHPQIGKHEIFRDYLKTHTADRELYIATKRSLYKKYSDDYPAYDRGKNDVIEAIKLKAKEWDEKKRI